MQDQSLGLTHFWASGDAVTHSVAYILLAMSVISWYFILSKAWSAWRMRRGARTALDQFWSARSLEPTSGQVRPRRRVNRFGKRLKASTSRRSMALMIERVWISLRPTRVLPRSYVGHTRRCM